MQGKHTHKDLVEIAYKWVLKNGSCGVAFKELKYAGIEYPDVIGFGFSHSVLIEVKVSRSDFLCDKKKIFRIHPEKGVGDNRYYCCPQGLIRIEELPKGWGLIYVNEKGVARCVHVPKEKYKYQTKNTTYEMTRIHKHAKNHKAEYNIMYSALRRLQLLGHTERIYDKI